MNDRPVDPDDDLSLLTGAYALDAVDDVERARIERHLAGSPQAAAEAAELRETAALLAAGSAVPPPPHLRADVLAAIARTPQAPPVTPARPAARRGAARWLGAAAVVAGLATAGLGVVAMDQRNDLVLAQQQAESARALSQVLAAADATVVPLSGEAVTANVVVSQEQDAAVLVGSGWQNPGGDSVYQAWALDGSGVARSAAVFVPGADGRVSVPLAAGLASVAAVAVTVEPAGGSPQPTSTPLASAEL